MLARSRSLWALIYWADLDEPRSSAGLLRPQVQLRLEPVSKARTEPGCRLWARTERVYGVALDRPGAGQPVELLVFSRHWLGPRRVARYRLGIGGAAPPPPGPRR